MNQKIKSITTKEIKDSRGKPTIEVEAGKEDFFVKAGVPSGASRGKMEAKAIDTAQAVKNVNEVIGPQLIGKDPCEQKEIDDFLIELDGTEDKSNLGANAMVGVSMAIAKLGAKAKNIPLWQHILSLTSPSPSFSSSPSQQEGEDIGGGGVKIPLACFNIIEGGAHAKNDLVIQEFMIVPQEKTFAQNFQIAKDIYENLSNILKSKFQNLEIGDEGGFAPPISSVYQALDFIKEASKEIKRIKIILDCAASQFQKQDGYMLQNHVFDKNDLIAFYRDLFDKYPIIGLEDPFGEEDWQGWQLIFNQLGGKIIIIGDDLLVTNSKRIKEADEKTACNGAIIKVNQIGTVSEAIEAVKLAKSFDWKIMVSHRSGETVDDFIADFAVGVGADFIKSGAPAKPERLSKYNRLLEIEQEISNV